MFWRTRMRASFFFLLAVATLLTMPVVAHHSHNNYAISEFTPLQGVVKEVHLINPHSWVYIEVKDEKSEPQLWALEATGPGGLERNGIKREDVKVGDTVKVRCHRPPTAPTAARSESLPPSQVASPRATAAEKGGD